jgi:hypothetical protein
MRRREKKSIEPDGRQSRDAQATPSGTARDDKMREARRDQIAANIDQWASSSGLQKPD